MMEHDFQATYWVSEVEDEVILVALADDAAQPQRFILVQRAEEVDEQDVALGMGTYHVEVCGPGRSGYGGLEQVEVGQGQAVFGFASQGWCSMLGRVRVGLPVGISEEEVLDGLRRVLGDEVRLSAIG